MNYVFLSKKLAETSLKEKNIFKRVSFELTWDLESKIIYITVKYWNSGKLWS